MPFKVLRDLVFLAPADLAAVEVKQKNETFAIKNTKKTCSLQWTVLSVADGASFCRDGAIITVPIPLKVGDIVMLTRTDTEARDAWNSTEVILNGTRGLAVTYDSILAKLEPDLTKN
jgi:hypothetical protein